jgi:hypothetical protein
MTICTETLGDEPAPTSCRTIEWPQTRPKYSRLKQLTNSGLDRATAVPTSPDVRNPLEGRRWAILKLHQNYLLSSGPRSTPLTKPMLQQLLEVEAASHSYSFSATEENGGGISLRVASWTSSSCLIWRCPRRIR